MKPIHRTNRDEALSAMGELEQDAGRRFNGWTLGGRHFNPADVIRVLSPHVSPERAERIRQVVSGRTYHIVPVVEGLANTGNVSAVMRTAEGLGLQAFHVVRGSVPPKHSSRTTQGAHKWLDVAFHDTPEECIRVLRQAGYQVLVTHLDVGAQPIRDADFSVPTAVVLGNEKSGVSREMVALADASIVLPMPGFVQSYNISVAAAMALYHANASRLRAGVGRLSEQEMERLTADFHIRSVRHAVDILARSV